MYRYISENADINPALSHNQKIDGSKVEFHPALTILKSI